MVYNPKNPVVVQSDRTILLETDNPLFEAARDALAQFAELDKSQLVLKLRKSREAKKKRGESCEGAKPFGFYPGEQDVLKRMTELPA